MIPWMSDETNRILDEYRCSVTGFDMERDAKDAVCILEVNGDCYKICLGDVSNLPDVFIDEQFAVKVLENGVLSGNETLTDLGDELWDSHLVREPPEKECA